jgi:hypothetical protein
MTQWVCPMCGGRCMMLSKEDDSIACLTDSCNFFLPTVKRHDSENRRLLK